MSGRSRRYADDRCRSEAILVAYSPRDAVDARRLARTICCAIDGGIIMSKALGRPDVLPEQMLMVRQHIKLVFAGAVPRGLEAAA